MLCFFLRIQILSLFVPEFSHYLNCILLVREKGNIWNMVPACLMGLICREYNNHTFEDIVRSVDLLKPMLVGTLFQWVRIWGFT